MSLYRQFLLEVLLVFGIRICIDYRFGLVFSILVGRWVAHVHTHSPGAHVTRQLRDLEGAHHSKHQSPPRPGPTSMTPHSTTLKYTSISRVAFDKVLSRYVSTVPENLRELDAFRYDAIPSKVAQRATKGDVYLEKEEVVKLVEWKLYV